MRMLFTAELPDRFQHLAQCLNATQLIEELETFEREEKTYAAAADFFECIKHDPLWNAAHNPTAYDIGRLHAFLCPRIFAYSSSCEDHQKNRVSALFGELIAIRAVERTSGLLPYEKNVNLLHETFADPMKFIPLLESAPFVAGVIHEQVRSNVIHYFSGLPDVMTPDMAKRLAPVAKLYPFITEFTDNDEGFLAFVSYLTTFRPYSERLQFLAKATLDPQIKQVALQDSQENLRIMLARNPALSTPQRKAEFKKAKEKATKAWFNEIKLTNKEEAISDRPLPENLCEYDNPSVLFNALREKVLSYTPREHKKLYLFLAQVPLPKDLLQRIALGQIEQIESAFEAYRANLSTGAKIELYQTVLDNIEAYPPSPTGSVASSPPGSGVVSTSSNHLMKFADDSGSSSASS